MLRLIRIIRPFSLYILVIWVITILSVSSTPNLPVLKIHTARSDIRLDYFMHVCEYGFLAFMTYLSFAGKSYRINAGRWMLVTVFLVAFAVLDELHQKFIPGRTVNLKDMIGNFAGVIGALIFCLVVFRKMEKNSENLSSDSFKT
jgi:VanZ family protein